MNRVISNLKFQIAFFILATSPALAGARLDLRPTPSVPPGGYQPGTDVRVDVFLIDTGNPQGNILLRGAFLDFSDSATTFTYLDPDGPGPLWNGEFDWDNEFGFSCGAAGCSMLPQASWVYPLPTPNSLFQITIPDGGEVLLGHLIVDVGTQGGVLDALNDDVADPNFGARVDFGFGGPNDPVTTWRAFNGDITGGVLELPVIPEPTSLVLITCAAGFLGLCRRKRFAQSR